jgi:hypothetical protein
LPNSYHLSIPLQAERPAAAATLGLPPVLDELYLRILHCCCDDSWHSRLAGAAAVKLLVHHPLLPPEYLQQWAPQTSRALLFIMRALPVHSVVEQDELDTTLVAFMRRTLLQEHPQELKVRSYAASVLKHFDFWIWETA